MQMDQKGKDAIEDIINRRESIASMQSQIKEDIKAIAEHLGGKPAHLSKIIALVEKEREKGDVISGERDIIDVAEEMAAQK